MLGCSVSNVTPSQTSNMQMAVFNGNLNLLKEDVKKATAKNYTLLMIVASRGNMKIIKYLVENGVDVNHVAETRYSSHLKSAMKNKNALDIAKINENEEIIALLEDGQKSY